MIRQVISSTGKPAYAFTRKGILLITAVLALSFSFGVAGTIGLVITRVESTHTRSVQKAGESTGVCLRKFMEGALPVLDKFVPDAAAPGSAYVRLQKHRYKGVKCPDRESR